MEFDYGNLVRRILDAGRGCRYILASQFDYEPSALPGAYFCKLREGDSRSLSTACPNIAQYDPGLEYGGNGYDGNTYERGLCASLWIRIHRVGDHGLRDN